jgi:hypothetical protein
MILNELFDNPNKISTSDVISRLRELQREFPLAGEKNRDDVDVNETLNQPYKWREEDSYNEDVSYIFRTNSNIYYSVGFEDKGNGRYELKFLSRDEFGDPQFEITDSGDAFRVFATVGSILKDFIQKYKPNLLTFSAKGGSRIKLYDRLAKLISSLGFKQQQTIGGPGYYAFASERNGTEVDEEYTDASATTPDTDTMANNMNQAGANYAVHAQMDQDVQNRYAAQKPIGTVKLSGST